MDAINSVVATAKALADAGFLVFLLFLVIILMLALRWAILRGDGFQAARVEAAEKSAGALDKNTEILREVGALMKDRRAADIGRMQVLLEQQERAK